MLLYTEGNTEPGEEAHSGSHDKSEENVEDLMFSGCMANIKHVGIDILL